MAYRAKHRWLVECDDERRSFQTRAQARAYAGRLAGHPANANIRSFGPYRNVDGVARVIDLGNPSPVDGRYVHEHEDNR